MLLSLIMWSEGGKKIDNGCGDERKEDQKVFVFFLFGFGFLFFLINTTCFLNITQRL